MLGSIKDCQTKIKATRFLFRNASFKKAWRILKLSQKPIIIGGCARSGTTLLLSILSCHPKIFGIAPETVALCPDGYGANGLYNKSPNLHAPLQLEKIYQYLIESHIAEHCERWCEKTPRNVLYFERILKFFGKRARLIHIVRDGRDVVTSKHPIDPARYWTTPDRWVQDVSAGQRLDDLPQVLMIRYEDLLREYEQTVRRVCDFIEEDFVAEFLDYPETARVVESLAWHESAQKINTKSIGRWQAPEFSERVAELLAEPNALNLLQHYGYES